MFRRNTGGLQFILVIYVSFQLKALDKAAHNVINSLYLI